MRLDKAAIIMRLRAAGCVYAEDEAELLMTEATTEAQLSNMLMQRVSGEPLEYIVGWAEFYGQRIAVGPGVFVPRRRSEFVVSEAAKLTHVGDTVLDLCCGSGALGAALATAVKDVRLYASDSEKISVEYAKRNLAVVGGKVFLGDMYAGLPKELKGAVNVILANAPYIPTADIRLLPSEAREYEPLVTLDGGGDGLDVQRRVAADAREWLAPGGYLFIETSEEQAPETVAIMEHAGLEATVARDDEWDATVAIGRAV